MEYNIMRELNVNEIKEVNGGTITNNPDGTKTTDDAKDCNKLYPDDLGDRIGCKIDVRKNGSHTTEKK